jgi:hypothetical protein
MLYKRHFGIKKEKADLECLGQVRIEFPRDPGAEEQEDLGGRELGPLDSEPAEQYVE